MSNVVDLESELNTAIDEFNFSINQKVNDFTKSGYNEDAIIMMDELAKHTSELASKFKDIIIKHFD